jgi:hypothetical protein
VGASDAHPIDLIDPIAPSTQLPSPSPDRPRPIAIARSPSPDRHRHRHRHRHRPIDTFDTLDTLDTFAQSTRSPDRHVRPIDTIVGAHFSARSRCTIALTA